MSLHTLEKRMLSFKSLWLMSVIGLMFLCIPFTAGANTLLGIYHGNQGWDMDGVKDLEAWQGKKNAVLTLFTNWEDGQMDNLFEYQLPAIWENGNVPLITWEPYTGDTTPDDIESLIAGGDYDDYIDAWADQMKEFLSGPDGVFDTADDRRAYVRLGHEMNGDWYPWSASAGENSPEDYVNMWRRVVDTFKEKGIESDHLQWQWSVNNSDIGDFTCEEYYPGDEYVDWVGISGYNWGELYPWAEWKTPAETFGPMISRLRGLTDKPLSLSEYASTSYLETGSNEEAKSEWIEDVFAYIVEEDVDMVLWFNEDKETDWAAFGGVGGDEVFVNDAGVEYNAYSAYRIAVNSDSFLSFIDESWWAAQPTPEPSTFALLLLGVMGTAGIRRKLIKKKNA